MFPGTLLIIISIILVSTNSQKTILKVISILQQNIIILQELSLYYFLVKQKI